MPGTRRQFMLLLLSTVSLASAWRARALAAPGSGRDPGHAAKLAASLFSRPESARAVGAACLRAMPGLADSSTLCRDLFPPSAQDWRIEFDRRSRSDFESGRVVSIEGWVLSVSEAKLCALVALS